MPIRNGQGRHSVHPQTRMTAMTLSQYTLLASSSVGLIVVSFLSLVVGALILAVTLFTAGSFLAITAAVGALWFSGPWRKPVGMDRAVVIRLR